MDASTHAALVHRAMRARAAAACVIQASWKARRACRVFQAKRRIATVLQAWLRGSRARALFSARLRMLVSTSQSRAMEQSVCTAVTLCSVLKTMILIDASVRRSQTALPHVWTLTRKQMQVCVLQKLICYVHMIALMESGIRWSCHPCCFQMCMGNGSYCSITLQANRMSNACVVCRPGITSDETLFPLSVVYDIPMQARVDLEDSHEAAIRYVLEARSRADAFKAVIAKFKPAGGLVGSATVLRRQLGV